MGAEGAALGYFFSAKFVRLCVDMNMEVNRGEKFSVVEWPVVKEAQGTGINKTQ